MIFDINVFVQILFTGVITGFAVTIGTYWGNRFLKEGYITRYDKITEKKPPEIKENLPDKSDKEVHNDNLNDLENMKEYYKKGE